MSADVKVIEESNQRISAANMVASLVIGEPNLTRTPTTYSLGSSTSSGSSSSPPTLQLDCELGNKCGKCQNHEIEISKKGHARDCPFKKCDCLKCRLLDARSDILQVISGKETKLKGTKKDPNCGFCQNHGVKILRKGHVRSCGFGQERHFRLDNCFDCEVHYIRNEVNRLQIKMRRAMKEDRTLSEEQRKTAREAITRDEVEKVCDMARQARKKRETILTQQVGECSTQQPPLCAEPASPSAPASPLSTAVVKEEPVGNQSIVQEHINPEHHHNHHLDHFARQADVWRPWSQHQVAAAIAAQQQKQQGHHQLQQQPPQHRQPQLPINRTNGHLQLIAPLTEPLHLGDQNQMARTYHQQNVNSHHQQQLNSAMNNTATTAANQGFLVNSLHAIQRQRRRSLLNHHHHHHHHQPTGEPIPMLSNNVNFDSGPSNQHSPPLTPSLAVGTTSTAATPIAGVEQPIPLTHRNMQEQQLFNTLFRLIVAQFALPAARCD